MIHIATIHWQTDKWIDLQLQYLKECIVAPFRIYAFLNGISQEHYAKFHYVCDEPVEGHDIKLNLLATIISLQAKDDDVLIFLDGDAFPVAPLDKFLRETLWQYPLTAIQRKENLSDIQPHPSFCATTVGFWKKINGDWKKGYTWQDSTGMFVSDIGGNLLQNLEELHIQWLPLHRSQSLERHPLWYGIYHDLVYHHGAGFRSPYSRNDITSSSYFLRFLQIAESKSRSLQFLLSRLFENALEKRISHKQLPVHDKMYDTITKDKHFFSKTTTND